MADFNADGRPDVAVANFDSDTVTIFLGTGDGTFTRVQDVLSGDGPAGIATGDFNRDRITDLAVTNRNDGTVSVFLPSPLTVAIWLGILVASTRYMRQDSLLKAENPDALGAELRTSADPLMRRRRQVVCLSLVSAAAMGVVAAYQIGLLKHVPEPRLPMLDADKVDASAQAYEKLSTGDAFLGFVSYGVTMLLAAIGGPRRYETHPSVPIVMAGKAVVDAAQAAKLTVDQWVHHGAFCSWCLTAAASTFAVIPAVLPELRAALCMIRRPALTPTGERHVVTS